MAGCREYLVRMLQLPPSLIFSGVSKEVCKGEAIHTVGYGNIVRVMFIHSQAFDRILLPSNVRSSFFVNQKF